MLILLCPAPRPTTTARLTRSIAPSGETTCTSASPAAWIAPTGWLAQHTNEIHGRRGVAGTRYAGSRLGCGYGIDLRYPGKRVRLQRHPDNISRKELDLAHSRSRDAGLDHLLSFQYGDFHHLEFPDHSYDVVWSQEAFLHAADKTAVLSEVKRVLKPGGTVAFTDILVQKDTPDSDRTRIYDRVKSPDMWDLVEYRDALSRLDFRVTREEDWSQHVARSYGWVRDRLLENRTQLLPRIGAETIDRTVEALSFWVDSANSSYIGWALFVAQKPS